MNCFSKKEPIILLISILVFLFIFWKSPALAASTFNTNCSGVNPGTYDCGIGVGGVCKYTACTIGSCPTLPANMHASSSAVRNCTTLKPECAGQCGVGGVPCDGVGCPCAISGGTCTYTCAPGYANNDGLDINGCEASLSAVLLQISKTGTGTVTSADTKINCGSTCQASYDPGTSVTLTALPDAGYFFSSWSGCDTPSGNTCSLIIPVTNKTVTANFLPYASLQISKTGTGTVTSADTKIDCGIICKAYYNPDTPVILTAIPGTDHIFGSWNGCNSTNGNICNVTATGAKNVTANFIAVFNFQLSDPDPATGWVIPGEPPVGTNVGTVLTSGTSELVTFTATGFPSGVSHQWYNPDNMSISNSCNPSCTRKLLITYSNQTGSWPITITVNGGGKTYTKTYTLTIENFDFSFTTNYVDKYGTIYDIFVLQKSSDTWPVIATITKTSGPPRFVTIEPSLAAHKISTGFGTGGNSCLPDNVCTVTVRYFAEIDAPVGVNGHTNICAKYGAIEKCCKDTIFSFDGRCGPDHIRVGPIFKMSELSPNTATILPGESLEFHFSVTLETEGPGVPIFRISGIPSGVHLTFNPSSCGTMSGATTVCPVTGTISVDKNYAGLQNQIIQIEIGLENFGNTPIFTEDVKGFYLNMEHNYSLLICSSETHVCPGDTLNAEVLPGDGLVAPSPLPYIYVNHIAPIGNSNYYIHWISSVSPFQPSGLVVSSYSPDLCSMFLVDGVMLECCAGFGCKTAVDIDVFPSTNPGNYKITFCGDNTGAPCFREVYYNLTVHKFNFSISILPSNFAMEKDPVNPFEKLVTVRVTADDNNDVSKPVDLSLLSISPSTPFNVQFDWVGAGGSVCPASELGPGKTCERFLRITTHPDSSEGDFSVPVQGKFTRPTVPESITRIQTFNFTILRGNRAPVAAIACDPGYFCNGPGCYCGVGNWVTFNGDGVIYNILNKSTDPDGDAIYLSYWRLVSKEGKIPDITKSCAGKCDFPIRTKFPKPPYGDYLIYLQVFDPNFLFDDLDSPQPITILDDVIAGFECSYDKAKWIPCETIVPISGKKLYFRDDLSDPHEHSIGSGGATKANIVSRTWEKNDEFLSSSAIPFITLASPYNGVKIKLIVEDSSGRTAYQVHQILPVIPLPKWKEIPPF